MTRKAVVITAATITDVQIRELHDLLVVDMRHAERQRDEVAEKLIECEMALGGYLGSHRARCAEILAARSKSGQRQP